MTMKVLITGASGSIGGEAFRQCLDHPTITKVVAFLRRPLTGELSKNSKLECIVIDNFSRWPEDVLQKHTDAVAMIW